MRIYYFSILAITLTLQACSGDKTPDLRPSFLNNQWYLTMYGFEMDNKTEILPNTFYFVQFLSDGRLFGQIDCNAFNSTFTRTENEISIMPLSSTEIACPQVGNEDYEAEVAFITNALNTAQSYSLSGEQLTLTANDSSQLIFIIPPL